MLAVVVLMILAGEANARCTNVGGNPQDDTYCSILNEGACKPEYTGGTCQEIVIGRCTNVGGHPEDNAYCSILQADVCKLEYTGNRCMMVEN